MATAELTAAVEQLDRAASTAELVEATRAIAALQDTNAADALIKVLGFNNPAVASVATAGLISLGRPIVPKLLVSLDARNYGARAWVVKVLASLRDPRGLDLLEHALKADIAPSVRRAATRGLAELDLDLKADGEAIGRCCNGLLLASQDDEWVVRYAAAFGLEQRLNSSSLPAQVRAQGLASLRQLASSAEDVKVVRLRATLALERLNAR